MKCLKTSVIWFALALSCSVGMMLSQDFGSENQTTQSAQADAPQEKTDVVSLLKKAAHSTQSNLIYILFLAFLAGIVTSFTPCIYPMIPITVGILQSQASNSLTHNFFSALSYVFGIALVYAGLGYASATTSLIFGKWLASPFFIFLIILFFLYLAFSMFGFYEIYMPRFLTHHNDGPRSKSLLHSLLFGMVSGTVASPCITPALAILLSIAAKSGSPLIGFASLFCFALGMGILLILVGTFSGTVHLLPQAGSWMDEIKKAFGFMMLGVCVYFLEPLVKREVILELYSIILLSASIYYFVTAQKNKIKLLGGLLLLLGSITMLGLAIKGSIFLR
jgi:thiol:disulfide interchange protein DsbD